MISCTLFLSTPFRILNAAIRLAHCTSSWSENTFLNTVREYAFLEQAEVIGLLNELSFQKLYVKDIAANK